MRSRRSLPYSTALNVLNRGLTSLQKDCIADDIGPVEMLESLQRELAKQDAADGWMTGADLHRQIDRRASVDHVLRKVGGIGVCGIPEAAAEQSDIR